ncbi:lanthionine synthetase LanC family protein [candidate division KSB1 bacterium]
MKSFFNIVCVVSICVLISLCGCGDPGLEYLETAEQAGAWMTSVEEEVGFRIFWPSQPDTMKRGEISFYHGVPGGILFFLELFKATGTEDYKTSAQEAADWLLDRANKVNGGYFWTDDSLNGEPVPSPGLYTGTAGVGTVFMEFSKYDNNPLYRMYARGAAHYLVEHMQMSDRGGSWGSSLDIISGSAGIGLFLIRAAEQYENDDFLEAAKEAGIFLIDKAIDDPPGKKWGAQLGATRIYPNFSHGTSGAAFFLATLYQATGDRQFLDAATAGAEWLEAHEEDHEGEGHAWYHHEPDGKDLYYAGWCHGPGGTARLFLQLYQATHDEKWLTMAQESARWLMTVGLPEKKMDGFWNVSMCCGHAGIIDFLLDMYAVTQDKQYWECAVTFMTDLTMKASPGSPGLKWVQAENRTRPDEVFAQTGYSQGAAGIGLVYLKMYAYAHKNPPFLPAALPDSPFWQKMEKEENK